MTNPTDLRRCLVLLLAAVEEQATNPNRSEKDRSESLESLMLLKKMLKLFPQNGRVL
jgi:hypothetical protein